jgi:hypothetical protein
LGGGRSAITGVSTAPAIARATRPILASIASGPAAQRCQSSRSSAVAGFFPSSPAGGDGPSWPGPVSAVLFLSPIFPSSIMGDRGGGIADDRGAARQRSRMIRPVRLASEGSTWSRSMRPRSWSRLRLRWTVGTDRPTLLAIDASQGQQDALSRAQKSRAATTRTSTGVSRGSAAMSWGIAAKGGDLHGAASARTVDVDIGGIS